MLKSTYRTILDTVLSSNLKVEQTLRSRIDSLMEDLTNTKEDLDHAKAKIERMELAMMPLSSAAGAAYVQQVRFDTAPKIAPTAVDPVTLDWASRVRQFMKEVDSQELKEKQDELQG